MCCTTQHNTTQLVLPPGLYQEGLPRLLSLSTSYRDVSCENLREVTWEQLSRKLGLVAEVCEGVRGWGVLLGGVEVAAWRGLRVSCACV